MSDNELPSGVRRVPHIPVTAASGADRQPCGCEGYRVHHHGCTKFASGADQPTLHDQLADALIEPTHRWYNAEARDRIVDALLPLIEADRERAKAEAAAEALEQCYREDRTTVAKLHPIEQLTCFVVKTEDMVIRAASLRATTGGDPS